MSDLTLAMWSDGDEQQIPEEMPIVPPRKVANPEARGAAGAGMPVGIVTECHEVMCSSFLDNETHPDFADEGRKLFARLNLGPEGAASAASKATGRYNDLDPVWRDPSATGGTVYVGNGTAAAGLHLRRERGISKVVDINCTDDLPFFHQRRSNRDLSIEYFRLGLYALFSHENRTPGKTLVFFQPLFKWIDAAVAAG